MGCWPSPSVRTSRLLACLLAVGLAVQAAGVAGSDEQGAAQRLWDPASDRLLEDPPRCIAPAWSWVLRERWTSWSQLAPLQANLTLGNEPPPEPAAPPVPTSPEAPPVHALPAQPVLPSDDGPAPQPPEGALPVAPPAPVEMAPQPVPEQPGAAATKRAPVAPPQAPAQQVVSSLAEGPVCACPQLGWSYWGASYDMVPGVGGSITLGLVMERTHQRERALELSYTWHDLWYAFSNEGQGGGYQVVRVGFAWRNDPCCNAGIVLRAGVGLVTVTGRPSDIDLPSVDFPVAGDYVGLYGGVGYEWRRGAWSHGPEVQLFGGLEWDSAEVGVCGTARWTLSYRY